MQWTDVFKILKENKNCHPRILYQQNCPPKVRVKLKHSQINRKLREFVKTGTSLQEMPLGTLQGEVEAH